MAMQVLWFLLLCILAVKAYDQKIYIDEVCNKSVSTLDNGAGDILLTRGKGSKGNCTFNLTTPDTNKRIKVKFTKLELSAKQECDGYIKIFSIQGPTLAQKTDKMCHDPTSLGSEVSADMNGLNFQLKETRYASANVTMFYTVFHEGACTKEEYECTNQQCVSKTLTCDGADNCGDNSDENADELKCGSMHVMASPVHVLVVVMLAGFFIKF